MAISDDKRTVVSPPGHRLGNFHLRAGVSRHFYGGTCSFTYSTKEGVVPTSSVLLKKRNRAIVGDARRESGVAQVICFQLVSGER